MLCICEQWIPGNVFSPAWPGYEGKSVVYHSIYSLLLCRNVQVVGGCTGGANYTVPHSSLCYTNPPWYVPYSRKIWQGIKFGSLADRQAYRRIKIRQYKVILDISRCGLWVVAAVLGDLYLCRKWMSCHCIDSSRKLACQHEYHHENITTFHCDYAVNRAFSVEK